MKNCNGLATLSFKMSIAIVAVIFLLPISATWGQQVPEPSAVIAIAPIDEQLNDVEYLAAATSEQMGQMSGLARFQAQGFLTGVDGPIGSAMRPIQR